MSFSVNRVSRLRTARIRTIVNGYTYQRCSHVPLIKLSLASELVGFVILGLLEEVEEVPGADDAVVDSAKIKNGFIKRSSTSVRICTYRQALDPFPSSLMAPAHSSTETPAGP